MKFNTLKWKISNQRIVWVDKWYEHITCDKWYEHITCWNRDITFLFFKWSFDDDYFEYTFFACIFDCRMCSKHVFFVINLISKWNKHANRENSSSNSFLNSFSNSFSNNWSNWFVCKWLYESMFELKMLY